MKQLLYIAFICFSFNGFAQDPEKKGICSSLIHLYHDSGNDTIPDDQFTTNGFYYVPPMHIGNIQIDSTTWSSDSLIYEITLPFGDSLRYYAYWHADGMCYNVDTSLVNHLVTVLEGPVFPITYEGFYSPGYYSLSQEGYIHDSCLLKIQYTYTHFVRVKFQDPPAPETPLDLPEITNDISMWLKNENTLTVKADQDAVWEINLYGLSGQMIQKRSLEGAQDLDISTLPKGCYVAHISSENGLKKQLKFIR